MDDPFEIVAVDTKSKKLKLKLLDSDSILVRHPDDVKLHHGKRSIKNAPGTDQQVEDVATEVSE